MINDHISPAERLGRRDWLAWLHGQRDPAAIIVSVVAGTIAVLLWFELDSIVAAVLR